ARGAETQRRPAKQNNHKDPAMTLPLADVPWNQGDAACTHSTDPLIHVDQNNAETFVFFVSKCFTYHAYFISLLFGNNKFIRTAGGGPPKTVTPFNHGKTLPVRQRVDAIVGQRMHGGGRDVDLIVAHTHSHNDHAAWDGEFSGRPRTTVVTTALAGV